jgi:hypothetical protein
MFPLSCAAVVVVAAEAVVVVALRRQAARSIPPWRLEGRAMDRYAADGAGDEDEGVDGEDTIRTNSNNRTSTELQRVAALPRSHQHDAAGCLPLRLPFPSLFIRSRTAFCCAIHTVPSLLLSSD